MCTDVGEQESEGPVSKLPRTRWSRGRSQLPAETMEEVRPIPRDKTGPVQTVSNCLHPPGDLVMISSGTRRFQQRVLVYRCVRRAAHVRGVLMFLGREHACALARFPTRRCGRWPTTVRTQGTHGRMVGGAVAFF